MLTFPLVWLAAAGVYLVFAGQLTTDELVAAALIGLAGALWWFSVQRKAQVRLRLEPAAAGAAVRAVVGLPQACVRVAARFCAIITGGKGGRIVEEAFETGRQNEPRDFGRRAVALLAASLAPDSFVVRVDKEAHRLRSHVVLTHPQPSHPRWGR